MWADVALVLAFILLGGLFAAAEMALVSLRPGQVSRLAQQGHRGAQVARLVEDPNRFLSAVQIGVTLAGFFSASVGAVTLAEPVSAGLVRLGVPASLAATLALVAVTVIVAYVSLVLGELAPKRIALQRAEGIARVAAVPVDALARLARPLIWLLGRSSDLVVRLHGRRPAAGPRGRHRGGAARPRRAERGADPRRAPPHRRGARRRRPPDPGDHDPAARRQRPAGRPGRARGGARTSGRPCSRYPVVDGGLDDVVGFVHLRDLLTRPTPASGWATLARPVLRLPDSRRALPALAEMRRGRRAPGRRRRRVRRQRRHRHPRGPHRGAGRRHHRRVRRSAHGTAGDGDSAAAASCPTEPVEAQLRLDEFADETGVTLPPGPYDTAAGWVVRELGRIPERGRRRRAARRAARPVRLVVERMRGRRVEALRLERVPEPDADSRAGRRPAGGPAGVASTDRAAGHLERQLDPRPHRPGRRRGWSAATSTWWPCRRPSAATTSSPTTRSRRSATRSPTSATRSGTASRSPPGSG